MNWRKSSWSFSNGNCGEVASGNGVILLRDSKNPDGGALSFTPSEWLRFLATLKAVRRAGAMSG